MINTLLKSPNYFSVHTKAVKRKTLQLYFVTAFPQYPEYERDHKKTLL